MRIPLIAVQEGAAVRYGNRGLRIGRRQFTIIDYDENTGYFEVLPVTTLRQRLRAIIAIMRRRWSR